MGNQLLCSENKLRCTEKCTRISMGQRREVGPEEALQPLVCDPAGAVFEETLEELNDIDRQLILFSVASNVIAVRWLLLLGANRYACDRNGTTCLHAASRSGALAVVDFLIGLDGFAGDGMPSVLSAADVAGWSPLHTAAFMGRHDIVERLLKHGADPERRNSAGRLAVDLCSDARTRQLLLDASQASGRRRAPSSRSEAGPDFMGALVVERVSLAGHGNGQQEVRFEPFFVPRNPVIREHRPCLGFEGPLFVIGRAIFARQPGRGLAFLVASGAIRDYPMDLVAFLQSGVDLLQLGAFLGEDFSLSKILRMEFMYSIGFRNCGVVGCLRKAFARLRAPSDLQKVDRVLRSLAEVWWRQHQRPCVPGMFAAELSADEAGPPPGAEVVGAELRRMLRGPGVLQQLLLSAVMLHWNLHGPLPRSQRLHLDAWLELHSGMAGLEDGDLPASLLAPIFSMVRAAKIPSLWGQEASRGGEAPGLGSIARSEGWARLIGEGLPRLLGSQGVGARAADCLRVSSMLSEATASSRCRRSDDELQGRPAPPPPRRQNEADRPEDAVWLTLCGSFLFLSVRPAADVAPFAFVYLRAARVAGSEAKTLFVLEAKPLDSSDDISTTSGSMLPLVLLLPDGRWQSYNLPKLTVEVCDQSEIEGWVLHLHESCSAMPAAESLGVDLTKSC